MPCESSGRSWRGTSRVGKRPSRCRWPWHTNSLPPMDTKMNSPTTVRKISLFVALVVLLAAGCGPSRETIRKKLYLHDLGELYHQHRDFTGKAPSSAEELAAEHSMTSAVQN